MNSAAESEALNPMDIFWSERNETAVSTSEAMKSKLLSGVTGGASFCSFFLRKKARFLRPGTGSPQM